MTSKENVIEGLKKIMDPELGLDIWTLGLIYDIQLDKKTAKIKMTFTSPMCPYGPQLLEQVKTSVKDEGLEADIELVFSPPWEPSEEVKMLLGLA